MDVFSGTGDGCEESGVDGLGDDGVTGFDDGFEGVGVSCPGDGRGVVGVFEFFEVEGEGVGDVGVVAFGAGVTDGDGVEDPQFCLLQFTW